MAVAARELPVPTYGDSPFVRAETATILTGARGRSGNPFPSPGEWGGARGRAESGDETRRGWGRREEKIGAEHPVGRSRPPDAPY